MRYKDLEKKEFIMNNLENLIRQKGLTKKEFADLNNITPTTLSRHIHNKVAMTVRDAEKYGDVLGVCARTVLFPVVKVAIICVRTFKTIAEQHDIIEHRLQIPSTKAIEIPAYYSDEMVCVYTLRDKSYNNTFKYMHGTYNLFPRFPVEQDFVDPASFQKQSLVMLENPITEHGVMHQLISCEVYPQPDDTYTLHSSIQHFEKVRLKWATPLVQVIYRPELRGVKITNM